MPNDNLKWNIVVANLVDSLNYRIGSIQMAQSAVTNKRIWSAYVYDNGTIHAGIHKSEGAAKRAVENEWRKRRGAK